MFNRTKGFISIFQGFLFLVVIFYYCFLCDGKGVTGGAGENELNMEVMERGKKLADSRKTMQIVIIGASFAAGWNPKDIAGLNVVNKGIGGEQTFQMLSRFNMDVVSLNPMAVIIWGFINDIFNSKKEEIDLTILKAKKNIEEMVIIAKKNKIIPILATEVTIVGKDSWLDTFKGWIGTVLGKESYQDYINKNVFKVNQWIKDYTKAQGLTLLDFQTLLSDAHGARKKEYASEDGIHISSKGYEKLTAYVEENLKIWDIIKR